MEQTPVAIVLADRDPNLAIGVGAVNELHSLAVRVVTINSEVFALISSTSAILEGRREISFRLQLDGHDGKNC